MHAAEFSSKDSAVFERVAEIDGQLKKTLPADLESRYDIDTCLAWINDNALEKVGYI